MKQGVKIHMPVLFKNIDLDDVRQIEFVFKKNRSHGAPSFKNELWTSDGSAGNCHSDSEGTQLNYEVVSEAICAVRASAPLSADWKRRIDEDYQNRGKKNR